MAENEIIAGLDLGTTKVAVVVAEQTEDGLDIIGIGNVPSHGLKKGVVVNIESTVQAIREAVEQAGAMAGCDIQTVYAGIAGKHIHGENKEGVAAVATREVSGTDVSRVLEQAKAFPLSADRQVIHVLPQEYIVDDQDGIKEPVGMSGVRLEARVHIVTAAVSSVQNITKCAERCDLEVADLVLQPIASAEASLSDDEREIGVCLMDVGGGTTDLVVYSDGAVIFSAIIPIGGINLTNDIAQGLRTPVAEAERLKIKYGCAATDLVDPDDMMEVPSVGGRPPRRERRQSLADIIEPRVDEIFDAARHLLAEANLFDKLAAGIVLTGGSTQLDGMPERAQQVIGLPVRQGGPTGIGGLYDVVNNPSFSTAVGLVRYGAKALREMPLETEYSGVRRSNGGWKALKSWFAEAW